MGPYHRIEGTLRSPSGLREQAQRLIEEAEAIEAAARPADGDHHGRCNQGELPLAHRLS